MENEGKNQEKCECDYVCRDCDNDNVAESAFTKKIGNKIDELEHCPTCLCARHDDFVDGCRGKLEPVSVAMVDDKWSLVLRCNRCSEFLLSKVSTLDSTEKLLSVSSKPLAFPPFPIEHVKKLMQFLNDEDEATAEIKIEEHEKGYYTNHACTDNFMCAVCGKIVTPDGAGVEHRNHCPYCLSSLHVDNLPGDRGADCGGTMTPISVWVRNNGEFALIHQCDKCGKLSSNCIATDDNPEKIIELAMLPFKSLSPEIE